MAFHITKNLGPGSIRFKVGARRTQEELDQEPLTLSSDGEGNYTGRRGGLYFAAAERVTDPVLEAEQDRVVKGSIFEALNLTQIALMIIGVVLVLIGIVVMMRKGAPGLIEIILGLGFIAFPVITTIRKRREILTSRERDRVMREAEAQRRREVLGNFLTRLENFENDMSEDNAEALRREHSALSVSYDMLAPSIRRTVARIAFRLLPELTNRGPEYVADEIDRATEATALAPRDIIEVKKQLYETALWHVLADDRLSAAHQKLLEGFRTALRLDSEVIDVDIRALRDFAQLRGVTPKRLPNIEPPIQLGLHEVLYHQTTGTLLAAPKRLQIPNALKPGSEKAAGDEECTIYITSKRLLVTSDVSREIALPKIYSIDLEADRNAILITDADRKEPWAIDVNDAVYTGAILEMAVEAAV